MTTDNESTGSRLTAGDIARLARLARIHLPPESHSEIAADLQAVIDELSCLEEADTSSAEEAAGVGAAALPLREDARDPFPLAVGPSAFAPRYDAGYFLVPAAALRPPRPGQ